MGFWSNIKGFFSWLWNDTPRWPTDEDVAAAEDAAAKRRMSARAAEFRADGARLAEGISSSIAVTQPRNPALLTSGPRREGPKVFTPEVVQGKDLVFDNGPPRRKRPASKTKKATVKAKKSSIKKTVKKPAKKSGKR